MNHTKSNKIYDSTKDETGRFRSGCRMYKDSEHLWIDYLTDWQGARDFTLRLPLSFLDRFPDLFELEVYGVELFWREMHSGTRFSTIRVGGTIR